MTDTQTCFKPQNSDCTDNMRNLANFSQTHTHTHTLQQTKTFIPAVKLEVQDICRLCMTLFPEYLLYNPDGSHWIIKVFQLLIVLFLQFSFWLFFLNYYLFCIF